jgi:hypothetical protein
LQAQHLGVVATDLPGLLYRFSCIILFGVLKLGWLSLRIAAAGLLIERAFGVHAEEVDEELVFGLLVFLWANIEKHFIFTLGSRSTSSVTVLIIVVIEFRLRVKFFVNWSFTSNKSAYVIVIRVPAIVREVTIKSCFI